MLTKIDESNIYETRSDIDIDKLIIDIKNKTIQFSIVEDLKRNKELSNKDYHRILCEASEYSGRWHDHGIIRDYADILTAVLDYRIKKYNNTIDAQNE